MGAMYLTMCLVCRCCLGVLNSYLASAILIGFCVGVELDNVITEFDLR